VFMVFSATLNYNLSAPSKLYRWGDPSIIINASSSTDSEQHISHPLAWFLLALER